MKDAEGLTALYDAESNGHEEVVRLLKGEKES
jgi:hypothetical protein